MDMPAAVGKIGKSTFTAIAELAVTYAPKKRAVGVQIDRSGSVWIDYLENTDISELVCTITSKTDPDWLAEEIAHEMEQAKRKPRFDTLKRLT